jgi:RNA polymerase sigma-70 factor (ECF subfamily)
MTGDTVGSLLDRHGDAVYRIAWNLCGSTGSAEEVTRQAFLSALRDGASAPSEIYGIAVQASLEERQRNGPSGPGSLEAFLPRFGPSGRLAPPDVASLEDADVTHLLREALDGIDEAARTAFVLCDLVELAPEEAGAILEAPPRAVRQRLHRARLMLTGIVERLAASQG